MQNRRKRKIKLSRFKRLELNKRRRWKKYRFRKQDVRLKLAVRRAYNKKKENKEEKEYALKAPSDFRFLVNTRKCKNFFDQLRSRRYETVRNGKRWIGIDFSGVCHIDFSAIMVLRAIRDELKSDDNPCSMEGHLPRRPECSRYIKESGFLDGMYDGTGKIFATAPSTQRMTIRKGQEKLGTAELNMIADISERVFRHLNGHSEADTNHSIMLKEICGNSVDWSDAKHGLFTIGAKYEEDKVIMVAVDLGIGILNSLAIRFLTYIKDMLAGNSHVEILQGAFDKKYGSASREPNRNKGLPSFKYANEIGRIKQLQVITNNVMLDFTNVQRCKKFESDKDSGFRGTLYSWVIDSKCFNLKTR